MAQHAVHGWAGIDQPKGIAACTQSFVSPDQCPHTAGVHEAHTAEVEFDRPPVRDPTPDATDALLSRSSARVPREDRQPVATYPAATRSQAGKERRP